MGQKKAEVCYVSVETLAVCMMGDPRQFFMTCGRLKFTLGPDPR